MIYNSPSGGIKNFKNIGDPYAKFGYSVGVGSDSRYIFAAPAIKTVPESAGFLSGESYLVQSSLVVRQGSAQTLTATGSDCLCYYDSESDSFKYFAADSGKYCTLRPYFFRTAYYPDRVSIYCNLYNSHSSRRALFRDTVSGSNNGLFFVPIFATKKGLALPTDFTPFSMPVLGGTDSGFNTYDKVFDIYTAYVADDDTDVPYVVGVVVVIDSSGSGSLFNDSINKFYGQRNDSGIVSVNACGIARSYFPAGDTSYDSGLLFDVIYASLPFSGKTISELKRVTVSLDMP